MTSLKFREIILEAEKDLIFSSKFFYLVSYKIIQKAPYLKEFVSYKKY